MDRFIVRTLEARQVERDVHLLVGLVSPFQLCNLLGNVICTRTVRLIGISLPLCIGIVHTCAETERVVVRQLEGNAAVLVADVRAVHSIGVRLDNSRITAQIGSDTDHFVALGLVGVHID